MVKPGVVGQLLDVNIGMTAITVGNQWFQSECDRITMESTA